MDEKYWFSGGKIRGQKTVVKNSGWKIDGKIGLVVKKILPRKIDVKNYRKNSSISSKLSKSFHKS